MSTTLIRNGHVVDPASGIDMECDLLLEDGKVAGVGAGLTNSAAEVVDARGQLVIPGIIDCHVHLSHWLGGPPGHKMLALAGVTTALDLAGPITDVIKIGAQYGRGLTIGCIDYVRPSHTVSGTDPSRDELRDSLDTAIQAGAIGQKVLGGHFPLTPEATARVIQVAAERGSYIAFHAGTLATPQSIAGMQEACDLSAGNPLHLAHINSYARGTYDSAYAEAESAKRMLEECDNIWSESYLAPFNGNSGKCANGAPESVATQLNLKRGGFAPTTEGLAEAITAGWAIVHIEADGVNQLVQGARGLAAWRAADSDIGLSFYANPFEARVKLAVDKRADGQFAVDALATDGGGIPRNDLCSRGLALTRLDALTLSEFVHKVCVAPAQMMGIATRKGHLGVGADGDVTIIDLSQLAAVSSFAHGRAIMRDGVLLGSGGQFLTMPEGRAAIEESGLTPIELRYGDALRNKASERPHAVS